MSVVNIVPMYVRNTQIRVIGKFVPKKILKLPFKRVYVLNLLFSYYVNITAIRFRRSEYNVTIVCSRRTWGSRITQQKF